jgi:hypothetical protein
LSLPVAVLVFAVAGSAATLALLMSPLGVRSVIAEKERDRSDRDARVLGGVAAARKRLSLLRIRDEGVKAALDALVLAAGRYLESAVRSDKRDPIAEDAVIGAVEAVDDYLRMADAASSADRHRTSGSADSGSAGVGAGPAERTVRVLIAAAEEIEARLAHEDSAADRMAAREELE